MGRPQILRRDRRDHARAVASKALRVVDSHACVKQLRVWVGALQSGLLIFCLPARGQACLSVQNKRQHTSLLRAVFPAELRRNSAVERGRVGCSDQNNSVLPAIGSVCDRLTDYARLRIECASQCTTLQRHPSIRCVCSDSASKTSALDCQVRSSRTNAASIRLAVRQPTSDWHPTKFYRVLSLFLRHQPRFRSTSSARQALMFPLKRGP